MHRSDFRIWTQVLNRCSRRCALLELTALHRLCEPLVGIRHRTRSWKVIRLQLGDLKSRRGDEFINLAVEVAVPTKKSVHIEIVAFTESRPVAFPSHVD